MYNNNLNDYDYYYRKWDLDLLVIETKIEVYLVFSNFNTDYESFKERDFNGDGEEIEGIEDLGLDDKEDE